MTAAKSIPEAPSTFLPGQALLRGILAIVVFLGHAQFASLWPDNRGLRECFDRLFGWNNQAVDIFFMLSGFILLHVHPLGTSFSWRDFYLARLARIFPLYFATTVFAVVLFAYCSMRGQALIYAFDLASRQAPFLVTWPPWLILANFLGVQQWTGFGGVHNSINFPAWSISVELLLYGTFYPLFRALFRGAAIGSVMAWALAGLCLACNVCYQLSGDKLQAPVLVIRGITGFAAGAFLYRAIHAGQPPIFSEIKCTGAALLFGLTVTNIIPRELLPLTALPLLYQLSILKSGLRKGVEICRFVGNLSYAVYLIHVPATKLILFGLVLGGVSSNDLFHAPFWAKMLYIAVTLTVVLGGAVLSYRFLEKPMRLAVKDAFSKVPIR